MRVDFARGVAAESRCPCRAHQIKSPGLGRGSEIWSYRRRSLLLQRSRLIPAELVVEAHNHLLDVGIEIRIPHRGRPSCPAENRRDADRTGRNAIGPKVGIVVLES